MWPEEKTLLACFKFLLAAQQFSNPFITYVSIHNFDIYLTQFKGLSEGENVLRKHWDMHHLPFLL